MGSKLLFSAVPKMSSVYGQWFHPCMHCVFIYLLYLHMFPHGDSSQVGRYTCRSHPDSDKFPHRMCLDSQHTH